jgi:hypothetical protein
MRDRLSEVGLDCIYGGVEMRLQLVQPNEQSRSHRFAVSEEAVVRLRYLRVNHGSTAILAASAAAGRLDTRQVRILKGCRRSLC